MLVPKVELKLIVPSQVQEHQRARRWTASQGDMVLRGVKLVRFFPAARKGGPMRPIFSAWPARRLGSWLAALRVLRSGDVEVNPGPRLTWTCDLCAQNIGPRHTSYLCYAPTCHWVHASCVALSIRAYRGSGPRWLCRLHNTSHPQNTSNPHSYNPQVTQPNTTTTPVNHHTRARPTINNPPTSPTSDSSSHTDHTDSHKKPHKNLNIIKININGIQRKITELTHLAQHQNADIITIQETKLQKHHRTPNIPNYTPIRSDRQNRPGGGLLSYIKNDITFTQLATPNNINTEKTEIQAIKIHLTKHKKLHIINLYIPPRDTNNPNHQQEDADITTCFQYIDTLPRTIITGDINAHHNTWHSPTIDHRGILINNLIQNSNHIILNTNTPTRTSTNINNQDTSPDITTITTEIYRHATWNTLHALNSDHLPILTTLNTKTKYKIAQYRNSYTNYKKADWKQFTQDIENTLTNSTPPTNPHTANQILTNIILTADKQNIPKGKMRNKNKLLPQHIRDKINTRNIIRQNDHRAEILD